MEILKYGKKLQDKKWIKKCKSCDSVLVYETEDIFIDMDADDFITCPVCGEMIYLGFIKRRYNPKKHGKCISKNKKIGFGD